MSTSRRKLKRGSRIRKLKTARDSSSEKFRRQRGAIDCRILSLLFINLIFNLRFDVLLIVYKISCLRTSYLCSSHHHNSDIRCSVTSVMNTTIAPVEGCCNNCCIDIVPHWNVHGPDNNYSPSFINRRKDVCIVFSPLSSPKNFRAAIRTVLKYVF